MINCLISTKPPHLPPRAYTQYLFGDWRYVDNPDYDPATPATACWRGENVIQLTNSDANSASFYGHGVGTKTLAEIKTKLDSHRKPGATRNSYLKDKADRLNTLRVMELLFR
jgi:protein-glutamine gamma-glutamyltransferase